MTPPPVLAHVGPGGAHLHRDCPTIRGRRAVELRAVDPRVVRCATCVLRSIIAAHQAHPWESEDRHVAVCRTCPWEPAPFTSPENDAVTHARDTGHTTSVYSFDGGRYSRVRDITPQQDWARLMREVLAA